MKEVRSRFGSWLLLVAVLVVASVASASSLYFGLADAQRPREGHWFVYALVLGLASGMLGALYPALRAANQDPVKALSYE